MRDGLRGRPLDVVVVKNAEERDKLLGVRRKHGIFELPDGRKVEGIINKQPRGKSDTPTCRSFGCAVSQSAILRR